MNRRLPRARGGAELLDAEGHYTDESSLREGCTLHIIVNVDLSWRLSLVCP